MNLAILVFNKQMMIVPHVMQSFSVCQIVMMIQWDNANVTKDITKQPIKLNVFGAYEIIVKYAKMQCNAKNA